MSNADKNESGKQGKKRTFAETAPVPEPEAACSGRPESAYHFTIEDVTAGAKAAAKKLRTAKASATREANAATLAQCSVGAAAADHAECMVDMAMLSANMDSLSAILSKKIETEPSSVEMRRATLGALRMDLEELSTDISVNGIVDHLVVDLSRKTAAPVEAALEIVEPAAAPESAPASVAVPSAVAAPSAAPSLRPGEGEEEASPHLDENDDHIAARTPGGTALVTTLAKTPAKTPSKTPGRPRAALSFLDANAVVQQSLAAVGGIASPGIFSPKSALKRTRRSVDAAGASPASLVKSMRKAMKASPVRGIFGLSGAPVIPSINFGDVTINLNTFGLPEVKGVPGASRRTCLPR